ncbi:MAG: hypothetical protein HQK91_03415 [Nitrospirae bacterium]|nr:hypothetical protein [Nitrospirota bacterium]
MRNEKTIELSIGEVTIYEIAVKHIRKLIRGEINLNLRNISEIEGHSENICRILDFLSPLISELSSMTKKQFERLSLSEMEEVAAAFIETNEIFFRQNNQDNSGEGNDESADFDKWICRLIRSGHVNCLDYGYEFFIAAAQDIREEKEESTINMANAIRMAFSFSEDAAPEDNLIDEQINLKAYKQLKTLGMAK